MKQYHIPLDDNAKQALRTLANSRILFAHHSLGGNILEGLEGILNEAGLEKNKLIKSYENSLPATPTLAHITPGQNTFPNSKVDDFARTIRALDTFVPQVASMKYCFVDFEPQTNIDEVFNYYKNNLEALKREKPEIIFAHITAPLKTKRNGLKQRLNKFLGRTVWNEESNIKRAEFNKRLRDSFSDDPIFDLARIESTKPDGSREQHKFKGQEYYSLAPVYTNDGSHLNALGKRIVAIEMSRFLSETINARQTSK